MSVFNPTLWNNGTAGDTFTGPTARKRTPFTPTSGSTPVGNGVSDVSFDTWQRNFLHPQFPGLLGKLKDQQDGVQRPDFMSIVLSPSGGGGGSGGGTRGGGAVSYMPGGAAIGKGMPKAWSPAQQNFEDAKAKGALTPEKIKQAQDFAAAHGRTFDPTLGYSTNTKPGAPAMPQGQTSTSQVGVPNVSTKPAANAPTSGGGNTSPHVFDGGKPVLTQAAKDKGITGWDENGAPIYGFAEGTPPGGMPLRSLEGRTFWTGEQGPELQQIKDGKLTVIPTTPTMEDRPSWSPVFAPTQGPVLRTAPSADRVEATPATPQGSEPASQGFTPAFSPTFAPTLSAPPGVRQTDFRRFLRTPQGMQFALQHEAQTQGMAAHNQSRAAAMNTERQWQMEDKNAAKQAKAEEEAKTNAAYDQIFSALTSNKAALPPVFKDLIGSAKDVKSKAALHDLVLGYLEHKATSDLMGQRQQEADQRDQQAANAWSEIPGAPDHLMNGRGQIITKPGKAMNFAEQMQALQSLQSQYGKTHKFTLHPSGISAEPIAEEKPNTRAPTVREIRTPGLPGQPEKIDYQQWYPDKNAWGPMTMMPDSSPSDQAKIEWMRRNGYKPDSTGQYPATGWSRAFNALSGQADAAASKPNWKAWAEQ